MTLYKKSVSWHEDNLKNMEYSLKINDENIRELQNRHEYLKNKCDKLRLKICKAKRLNISEFDAEEAKFNKNLY